MMLDAPLAPEPTPTNAPGVDAQTRLKIIDGDVHPGPALAGRPEALHAGALVGACCRPTARAAATA